MYIDKEDLTLKELNSLRSTYGLFDKVNFDEQKYFKDNESGKLFEISLCSDGSLTKRINQLEKIQKSKELLTSLGF